MKNMTTYKYYAITVRRGHNGIDHDDAFITFYFKSASMLNAMDKAKKMPGVKHDQLPIRAVEVTYEEYKQAREHSAYAKAGAKKNEFISS